MSNGLQRLGQAARKLFTGRKKVNISEVNKEKKNTPTINSSGGAGYRAHVVPGVIHRKMQTQSPINKSYRCGRNWIS